MAVNLTQILEQWKRDWEAFTKAVQRSFEELTRINFGLTRPLDPLIDFAKRKLREWGVVGVEHLRTEDLSIDIGTKGIGVATSAITHLLLKEPLASILQLISGLASLGVSLGTPSVMITDRARREAFEFSTFMFASLLSKWIDLSNLKGVLKEVTEVSSAATIAEWFDKAIKDFEEVGKDIQSIFTWKVEEKGTVKILETPSPTSQTLKIELGKVEIVPQYEFEVRTTSKEVKIEETKCETCGGEKVESSPKVEEIQLSETQSPEVTITVVSRHEGRKREPKLVAQSI